MTSNDTKSLDPRCERCVKVRWNGFFSIPLAWQKTHVVHLELAASMELIQDRRRRPHISPTPRDETDTGQRVSLKTDAIGDHRIPPLNQQVANSSPGRRTKVVRLYGLMHPKSSRRLGNGVKIWKNIGQRGTRRDSLIAYHLG